MAELTKLGSEKHGGLKVRSDCGLRIAADQHIMGLKAPEVARAACSFPVFFSRVQSSGNLALSAVCGLEPGNNLFVDDGKWEATYLPVMLQTYPLFLMTSTEDERGYTVGINEESDAFSTDEGEALFDDNGKPSIFQSNVTALLEAGIQDDMQTHHFLKALDEMSLHKPIDILVQFQSGEGQTIKGLSTIDEDRLQSLSASELETLSKKGYLMLIHAMLMSIFQLNTLILRQNESSTVNRIAQIKLQVARDAADDAQT